MWQTLVALRNILDQVKAETWHKILCMPLIAQLPVTECSRGFVTVTECSERLRQTPDIYSTYPGLLGRMMSIEENWNLVHILSSGIQGWSIIEHEMSWSRLAWKGTSEPMKRCGRSGLSWLLAGMSEGAVDVAAGGHTWTSLTLSSAP